MLPFRRREQFTDSLFDFTDQARPAALILTAILQARCPRLSDISQGMPGNSKALHRFLATLTSEGQFSALRNGFRAVKEHWEVLRRDAQFADAYLTVGLYEYVVGSLPLAVKILVALGGIRGSRERGIEQLEEAARSGKYVADDARTLLVAVYYREGRFSDALRMLEELIA